MKILVLGAGNGGMAAAVELSLAGHDVTIQARSEETLAPLRPAGIGYMGVFGEGRIVPQRMTADLPSAAKDADVAVVALPTFALGSVARALHLAGWDTDRPIILNPGHTGGAFEFDTAWRRAGGVDVPIVEFSTLSYVARKPSPDIINITGRAKALRAAALRGGEAAMDAAMRLFPGVYDCGDVIASGLSNVNMIVHPPGAMLGASWVEATGGNFTFYVEGLTPGVVRVMESLDLERIAVGRAFGHELPTIIGEMKAIGTVPSDVSEDDYRAIAAGDANKRIKAPDNLLHRYYSEDFTHGLVPFLVLARIANVKTPVANSLVTLHEAMVRELGLPGPRDGAAMGVESATLQELLRRIVR